MPINAQGYFNHLKHHLNTNYYAVEPKSSGELVLSEKIDGQSSPQKVLLKYKGDAFAIKLDKGSHPLFHFLDDTSKPWSRRCDFVIFHRHNNGIKIYCIEFKTANTNIPQNKIIPQLSASVCWCRTLHSTIKSYTKTNKRLHVTKYVFTKCINPEPDLDPTNRYLNKDSSVRHYLFKDVNGMSLESLENDHVETIN